MAEAVNMNRGSDVSKVLEVKNTCAKFKQFLWHKKSGNNWNCWQKFGLTVRPRNKMPNFPNVKCPKSAVHGKGVNAKRKTRQS